MRVESLVCGLAYHGWAKAAESLPALKSRALEVVIDQRSLELSYDPFDLLGRPDSLTEHPCVLGIPSPRFEEVSLRFVFRLGANTRFGRHL